jgi:hypothetical protein
MVRKSHQESESGCPWRGLFSDYIGHIRINLAAPKNITGSYLDLYVVGYIGVIFWFYEAPDIRFGYGVPASTVLLAGTLLLVWILQKVPKENILFSV